MKLIKNRNLEIVDGDLKIELPLVTSIVFYNAAYFENHLRWRVREDAELLKPLVLGLLAKNQLSNRDFQTLQFYEQLFSEIKAPKTRAGKDAYNASQKDLMSVRNRATNPQSMLASDENFPIKTKFTRN